MKSFDGYLKRTIGNLNVLLAGGDTKSLSNIVGSLLWDSTNLKLKVLYADSTTNWTDLITFGSNAFNSTDYVLKAGDTMTGHLKMDGTVNLGAAWDHGIIAGANGHDKVVATYLASSTNGAVVGAHNSACSAWAPLNVAGSTVYINNNENKVVTVTGNKVGIGTTSPTYLLQLASTYSSTLSISSPVGSVNGATNYPITLSLTGATGAAYYGASGCWATDMAQNSRFGHLIGKNWVGGNGALWTFCYLGDNSNANYMSFGLIATNEILNITKSRCVGINTITPGSALEVAGNITIRTNSNFAALKILDTNIHYAGICLGGDGYGDNLTALENLIAWWVAKRNDNTFGILWSANSVNNGLILEYNGDIKWKNNILYGQHNMPSRSIGMSVCNAYDRPYGWVGANWLTTTDNPYHFSHSYSSFTTSNGAPVNAYGDMITMRYHVALNTCFSLILITTQSQKGMYYRASYNRAADNENPAPWYLVIDSGGGSIDGALYTNSLGKNGTGVAHLISPASNTYSATSGTGAISIAIPNSGSTMYKIIVEIFGYGQGSATYHISVYSTGLYSVYSVSALNTVISNYTVRLGTRSSDNRRVVYIGEANTSWSYPKVIIHDIIAGHSYNIARLMSEWEVYLSTELESVTSTWENPAVWTYPAPSMKCPDTRNVDELPTDFKASYNAFLLGFKASNVNGINGWHGLASIRFFGDNNSWSAGGTHLFAFNGSNIYYRTGSGSTWNSWVEVVCKDTDGNISAVNFYSTSDARKKHDIISISDHVRSFILNDSGLKGYGFIAQELEEEHPELVDNSGEYKTINYNSALSYCIAQLENKIKELEERILELENKLYG